MAGTLVPTQWGTIALALTATLRALPGWRAPTDQKSGVTVYFGPEVDSYGDRTSQYVVVAWPGDDSGEGADSPGSVTQKAAAMSTSHPREETGEIRCVVVADTGANPDFAGALKAAEALLAQVQSALRANQNLGLPDPTVRGVTFDTGSPTLMKLGGAVCRWEFRVAYTARLGVV
jgi:hypothetical protein